MSIISRHGQQWIFQEEVFFLLLMLFIYIRHNDSAVISPHISFYD
jgi:hypothetical protein